MSKQDASILAILGHEALVIKIDKSEQLLVDGYMESNVRLGDWIPDTLTITKMVCICGQPAMRDSSLCADCRTAIEECGPILAQEVKPESPRRPYDTLSDWISRPCGTIYEGRRR